MKLLLKRYLLHVIYVFIIYSLIFIVFNGNNYFNIILLLCLILAYLIRIFDDYNDYEKDLNNNKIIFSKNVLFVMFIILGLCFVCVSIIFGKYLFLLLIILLILTKKINCLKLVFIPSMISLLVFYEMVFNYWLILFIILFIIVDLFLLLRR